MCASLPKEYLLEFSHLNPDVIEASWRIRIRPDRDVLVGYDFRKLGTVGKIRIRVVFRGLYQDPVTDPVISLRSIDWIRNIL